MHLCLSMSFAFFSLKKSHLFLAQGTFVCRLSGYDPKRVRFASETTFQRITTMRTPGMNTLFVKNSFTFVWNWRTHSNSISFCNQIQNVKAFYGEIKWTSNRKVLGRTSISKLVWMHFICGQAWLNIGVGDRISKLENLTKQHGHSLASLHTETPKETQNDD